MAKGDVQSQTDETLDITEADIWQELDGYFTPAEKIQPGDITIKMLMERYAIGERKAKARMEAVVAGGGFVMLKVAETNGGMWVLRKVV